MKHVRGITREVFLMRNYAIKIPSFRSWSLFLSGLLANMQEATWSGYDSRLCPVLRYIPGGFVVVMPRCDAVADVNYADFDGLPCDFKDENFGIYNGRTVLIDYGS
jgi:hypothetical protein